VAVGIAVLGLNALASAWGGIAWLRRDPSTFFWYVLRAAQGAVVVQAVLGFVLLAEGHEAPDGLHLLYGITPLVVAFVTEGMRAGAAQAEVAQVEDVEALERREQVLLARRVVMREMGVMTIGTLMIVTLSLRAAMIF
jgi:hypothetical protein